MTKNEIRSEILKLRRNKAPDELQRLSAKIISRLLDMDIYKDSEYIMTYVSYNHEADTTELIKHALNEGKKVLVPKVCGDRMDFYIIHSLSELKPSAMGILEPEDGEVIVPEEAMMIMPGAAFDKAKNRIGYGGGYYDRYIAEHDIRLYKVAFAYGFQIVPEIPANDYDIRPDIIITEDCIL